MVFFRKSLNARQTDMRIFDNVYRFTVQFSSDAINSRRIRQVMDTKCSKTSSTFKSQAKCNRSIEASSPRGLESVVQCLPIVLHPWASGVAIPLAHFNHQKCHCQKISSAVEYISRENETWVEHRTLKWFFTVSKLYFSLVEYPWPPVNISWRLDTRACFENKTPLKYNIIA